MRPESSAADRVQIRRAVAGDAEAIAEIHVRSWQAAYRDILPVDALDGLDVARRAEAWRERLADAQSITLVAELGGRVAGFASGGRARDEDVDSSTAELYAIYVRPEAWRRGVGRALWQEFSRVTLEKGRRDVVLWVLAENDSACRFYESLGCIRDGGEKSETILGTCVREVRYHRRLV